MTYAATYAPMALGDRMANAFTISIDVPDIEQGVTFFTDGLDFQVNAQLAPGIYELEFAGVRVFLIEKPAHSLPHPGGKPRTYGRHWTPVHMDLEVDDLDRAVDRAVAAGAIIEERASDDEWGDIATLADPFGNGFCLIQPPPK